MIPVFLMMRDMNLMNTYFALICPSVDAFGVFLIKQFMSSVPDELIEAGQIDGGRRNLYLYEDRHSADQAGARIIDGIYLYFRMERILVAVGYLL